MAQQISTNTFGVAKFIVSADPTQGTHTNIAAAVATAPSGSTIFFRDGNYAEDVTISGNYCFSALLGSNAGSGVHISGILRCTAGAIRFSGISFYTSSDYFMDVSGSASVVIENSDIRCINHNGIVVSSGGLLLNCCTGDISNTGISLFDVSGGQFNIYFSQINNSGSSVTSSSVTGGVQQNYHCNLNFPVDVSSTGTLIDTYVNRSLTNTTAVSTSGTSSFGSEFSYYSTGTASSVSIGSGTSGFMLQDLVQSTNANAITGAGTLNYGAVAFLQSSTINTTTQNPLAWPVKQGGTGISSATAYALIAGGTTSTGPFQSLTTGTAGQVLVSQGASALPTWGANLGFSIVRQVFTTTGTYTPTSNMAYADVEVLGGGGGSGGTANTGASQCSASGGGGSGGYSRKVFTAATIGASQAVTIGAAGAAGSVGGTGGTGGTTSLGALIQATGGSGGGSIGPAATQGVAAGGAGGSGSGGDFNTSGSPGEYGFFLGGTAIPGALSIAGSGGSSFFGGGSNSAAGVSYGGGGSGRSIGPSDSGTVGYAGAPGIIVVTEYIGI